MRTFDFTKTCACCTEAYYQNTGGCPVHGINIKLHDSAAFPNAGKKFRIEEFTEDGNWKEPNHD